MALINFAKLSVRLQTSHFSKNFTSVHSSRVVVNSVSCSLIGTSPKCPTSCYAVSPVLTMASTAGTSPTRRHFHSPTANLRREIDRRSLIASAPRVDEGTQGEKIHDIDYLIEEKTDVFPDENLPNRLFGGIRFADLPICHIKASPNNTIMALTNAAGKMQAIHSCGREGFKNTREGTNIAAQATAITMGMKSLKLGIQTLRVTVRGLGPGRMSAIKGLTMAGINVVSVTDVTPIAIGKMPRPKKQRKL